MSTEPEEAESPESPSEPGKVRTWWHPRLAALARHRLGDHYQVTEEVKVGEMPLWVDLVVLRRGDGDLPLEVRFHLAGIAERLNQYTLVELKGPTSSLRRGDFHKVLAYTLLYLAAEVPELSHEHVSILVIAPRLTRSYRRGIEALGSRVVDEAPGVKRVEGRLPHAMWVLETDVLGDAAHPLLLFSSRLLQETSTVYAELRSAGCEVLMNYMAQQIQQFRLMGEEFDMQHLGASGEMRQLWRKLLDSLPPKERLQAIVP